MAWNNRLADEEERWTGNPQLTNDDKQGGKKNFSQLLWDSYKNPLLAFFSSLSLLNVQMTSN